MQLDVQKQADCTLIVEAKWFTTFTRELHSGVDKLKVIPRAGGSTSADHDFTRAVLHHHQMSYPATRSHAKVA
jgi:hypothetical protein